VRSIQNQTTRTTQILICTSTPSGYILNVGAACAVPVLENPLRSDIATDWNFALASTDASFVTLAHQDDVYDRAYLETMKHLAAAHPEFVMAFTAYRELTDQSLRPVNLNLRVKRGLCNRAFADHAAISSPTAKRRLLNLGNPICCPSVMLNRQRLPDFRFSSSFKTNLDWDAWTRLSAQDGEFVYSRQALVRKRVHAESETTVTIASNVRKNEDLRMFRRFWPKPVAALIAAVYSLGYLSNRI